MMSINGKLLRGGKCSGTVTLRAGTNTVTTSSYGRASKDQEYSPGHPYYIKHRYQALISQLKLTDLCYVDMYWF